MNWQNRITGYGTERPAELVMNPLNIRVHPPEQMDAMRAILDTIGWVDDVIVNRTSGVLLDGHLRVSLALERGELEIPVAYVELTAEEERLALATFDRIGTLATLDASLLGSLMRDVSTDHTGLMAAMASFAEQAGVVDLAGMDDPDLVDENDAGATFAGDDEAGDQAGEDPQLPPADTTAKIGPDIKFPVARGDYEMWLETMRFDFGFGYKELVNAILKLLGFDHVV